MGLIIKRAILVFLSVTAICLVLLSYEGGGEDARVEPENIFATNFSLPSLDGRKEEVKLRDFEGKPLVINFWASWCVPCREEIPFLEQAWNEYKEKGVVFIGIDMLDQKEIAKEFLESKGVSYINLYDSSGQVGNNYGAVSLPTTVFIDRKGKVVRKSMGGFLTKEDEKRFKKYIEELI